MIEKLKTTWRRELLAFLGTLIYCVGINMFVVPAGLYSSGLLGLCQVIRTILEQFFHISFGNLDISGLIYYAVNLPILVLAWKRIGKTFVIRTLVFVSWSVLLLSLIPTVPLLRQIVHERDPQAFIITKDHVKIYGNYDKKLS